MRLISNHVLHVFTLPNLIYMLCSKPMLCMNPCWAHLPSAFIHPQLGWKGHNNWTSIHNLNIHEVNYLLLAPERFNLPRLRLNVTEVVDLSPLWSEVKLSSVRWNGYYSRSYHFTCRSWRNLCRVISYRSSSVAREQTPLQRKPPRCSATWISKGQPLERTWKTQLNFENTPFDLDVCNLGSQRCL